MIGQSVRLAQRVQLGTWGELELLRGSDPVPPLLAAVDFLWRDEERLCPVLLTVTRRAIADPYIAVWPTDSNGPGERHLTSDVDLDGVVLAEPRLDLVCFSCEQSFAGLMVDAGLPFFSTHIARHQFTQRCPSCGANYSQSSLQALLLFERP